MVNQISACTTQRAHRVHLNRVMWLSYLVNLASKASQVSLPFLLIFLPTGGQVRYEKPLKKTSGNNFGVSTKLIELTLGVKLQREGCTCSVQMVECQKIKINIFVDVCGSKLWEEVWRYFNKFFRKIRASNWTWKIQAPCAPVKGCKVENYPYMVDTFLRKDV